jgi:hypothetical protein
VSASTKNGGQCTPGCSNIRERLRMHIVSNYGNDTLVKNIAAEAGATVDSPDGEGSLVDGSLAAMADATFCLQPGGQTLTRAAFYQSIVYGCIPVVFREDFHFTHTLAFSETIPYKELWVHIPETSVMAGEDFVKTLKAVPQATIAAKRKLMRKYAPMLDWNCGLKEGCDTSSTGFQASKPDEGFEQRADAAVKAAADVATAARAMQARINGEEMVVKGPTEANIAKGAGKCTGPLGSGCSAPTSSGPRRSPSPYAAGHRMRWTPS